MVKKRYPITPRTNRGSKPQPLGDLMRELVEELGMSSRFGKATVISVWQDISGSQIGQVTESVRVEERRLVVKLNSASWRQELHLQRRLWCKKLNAGLGRPLIDEIVFR